MISMIQHHGLLERESSTCKYQYWPSGEAESGLQVKLFSLEDALGIVPAIEGDYKGNILLAEPMIYITVVSKCHQLCSARHNIFLLDKPFF